MLGKAETTRLLERFGRKFRASDVVFRAGDDAGECFLIHEGTVRIVRTLRGTQKTVALLGAEDWFGEEALADRPVRSATAMAASDLTVLVLERATVAALVASSAELASKLMSKLVRRMRRLEEQLDNSVLPDAASKVVRTLLEAASEGGAGALGANTPIALGALELCVRTGLNERAVSSALEELQQGGHIHVSEGTIQIASPTGLATLFDLLGKKERVRSGRL